MTVEAIARSFGLTAGREGATSTLRRNDVVVRLDLELFDATPEDRNALLVACLGARLGIDRLRFDRAASTVPPSELEQRLIPRAAAQLASAIADVAAAAEPWLPRTPFVTTQLHETGKDLVFATHDDLARGPVARAIEDGRRTTFYRAYRLRPAQSEPFGAGRLNLYRTTGGLASSVATLFPDFDFDAARGRGALAVPDYNTILVWRPGDGERPTAALRAALRAAVAEAPLPFSRRLYTLSPTSVIVGETCGADSEFDPAEVTRNLISVTG